MTTHGIHHLELSFDFNGMSRTINPTVIWDQEHLVLIDAGFPGQGSLFKAAIERLGLLFSRLDAIIVTHQDPDHIGGLAEIAADSLCDLEVLAHEREKPYIQGDERFVKNSQRGAPPPVFPHFERVKVTRTVADGETLPHGGGITVIHTPGHTPGHICLYHQPSRTLITGDALNVVDGALTGPNPQYTHDLAQAVGSLKKLAAYDIRRAICYHGGVYDRDVNRRIAEIAAQGAHQS